MRQFPVWSVIPLIAAGCSVEAGGDAATPGDPLIRTTGAVSISPFADCAELRDYYIEGALGVVGPYGLSGNDGGTASPGSPEAGDTGTGEAGSGDDSAGGSASDFATPSAGMQHAGNDFSGTNNQEDGVDEADRVLTDGSIIAAVVRDDLQIVDVASAEVAASIPLAEIAPDAYDAELMLSGETLLVLSSGYVDTRRFETRSQGGRWDPGEVGADDGVATGDVLGEDMMLPGHGGGGAARTTITRIDIGEPAAPDVLGSTRIEGSYRSARMVAGRVRLVLQSEPSGLRFQAPRDGSLFAERDAAAANRRVIEESTIADWVPHLEIIEAGESRGEVRQLTDCAQVHQPETFSGLSTLSVVTVDARSGGPDVQGVGPTSTVSLVAAGETVYASTDRLVVATSPWGRWATSLPDARPDGEVSTALHSFDISDPDRTDYVASGRVKGTLVNQFALSEHDGVLRVATTSEPAPNSGEDSESALVVLVETGDELSLTGVVAGLGVTEQIKSVRYLSPDLAAVVTFRQTDPLYLIDTSDPSAPRVTGELKIPGYSAYLHPLGADQLLGIGQEADPSTGVEEGLQASLFDISDRSEPRRVDQLTWPGGFSLVEHDHRAFTAWAQTGQFFLPAAIDNWSCNGPGDEVCGEDGASEAFAGVLTGSVEGAELVEGRRLPTSGSGLEWPVSAERTLVIEDDLWTLHAEGMNRYDLETLDGGLVLRWNSARSSSNWAD